MYRRNSANHHLILEFFVKKKNKFYLIYPAPKLTKATATITDERNYSFSGNNDDIVDPAAEQKK